MPDIATMTDTDLDKAIAAAEAETALRKSAYKKALADQPLAVRRAKEATKAAQLDMHRAGQTVVNLCAERDRRAAAKAARKAAPVSAPPPQADADDTVGDDAPVRTTKKKRTPRRAD